jgi:flagellin-like hook-associated protein FlgL
MEKIMAGQLTETEINIRKQTLQSDLEAVKESLNKLDAERTNLVAQHHAISGAIQQCDLFLSDLKTVVSETTDSSIPSKKKG